VLVFGTLLAEVQTVLAELRKNTREKNQVKQQVMWYLREKGCPSNLEYKVTSMSPHGIRLKRRIHIC